MNAPSMATLPGIAKIEVQTSGKDHDIVVWNPHIAKSKRIGDFGDDVYFFCILMLTDVRRGNIFFGSSCRAGYSHNHELLYFLIV